MYSSILQLDYIISKNKNNLSENLNFKKILKKTGIKETFKADTNEDVINLAEKLCKKNHHYIKGSDCLIFVTQTPRYLLPSCSCILQDKLELGNMDAYRDWGHSYDYVRAMHLIMQQDVPGDWVVATGETRSVRDMCEYVFGKLGLDYKEYVVQNEKFLRPEELPYLKGDSTKIRTELGWKPTYTFESMMDEMIDHWMKIYNK